MTRLHGMKCPVSYWVRMPDSSTDQPIEFATRAVLNSGWKLNGVPAQVT